MTNTRSTLAGLAFTLLAIPIWGLICYEASLSTGFGDGNGRYIIPPLVLCGLTVAIHRLLRPRKLAWPLSMFIAGVGALGVLMWAAG
jgi:hypothetical protein